MSADEPIGQVRVIVDFDRDHVGSDLKIGGRRWSQEEVRAALAEVQRRERFDGESA